MDWTKYLGSDLLGLSGDLKLSDVISGIVDLLLLFAGVVAVIYLIIGGYQYVTSAGNPEQAGQAKNTILYSVIGIIIIFAAFLIVDFILREIKGP